MIARLQSLLPFLLRAGAARESAPDCLELTGERVSLRPLRTGDADAMFACASDPEVTKFLPWYPAGNIASVHAFLDDQIGRRRRGESLGLAVVEREGGALIGSVDLMNLRTARKTGAAEIGYLLRRSHWGQGFMGEAAALARDYGFRTFGLGMLLGFADADNAASRGVLEKLGMHAKGRERRTVKNEERLYIRYELTRTQWEETLA